MLRRYGGCFLRRLGIDAEGASEEAEADAEEGGEPPEHELSIEVNAEHAEPNERSERALRMRGLRLPLSSYGSVTCERCSRFERPLSALTLVAGTGSECCLRKRERGTPPPAEAPESGSSGTTSRRWLPSLERIGERRVSRRSSNSEVNAFAAFSDSE
tara:strand:- start:131 stop:604 length:474 start_codon:yes stop_codon:yes gene_type:complete